MWGPGCGVRAVGSLIWGPGCGRDAVFPRQRCGRSVITSLRAADPLGRFLPPAGGAALRDGRRVGSAAPPPRRSNVISLD